jgi:hypothetical protein
MPNVPRPPIPKEEGIIIEKKSEDMDLVKIETLINNMGIYTVIIPKNGDSFKLNELPDEVLISLIKRKGYIVSMPC